MNKIILWGVLCAIYFPIQAQQNYKKVYKKAYSFTNTNQDSALVWAEKCLDLAQNSKEKYLAYYLRGFNAHKLCMYGTALHSYTQAREFSPDSVSWYKSNIGLANTYLSTGLLQKAIVLNQKSIEFNSKSEKWINLSYAYEVKSNILIKQKDSTALEILRKALNLRKKHAPKQVGYTYERLARALSTFARYDSAILYQRLAIKHYPIKSSNKTASLFTQLAKYLIMANQADKAFTYLHQARLLKKPPMMELFWCHTFGLYLSQTNQVTKARQMLVHCDSLLQNLLYNAPDWVTQRTISEYAQDMYRDVLALYQFKTMERKVYETRLKAVQASYAHANSEIRLKDTLHNRRIAPKAPTKETSLSKSKQPFSGLWYWWLALILLGLGIGWLLVRSRVKSKVQELNKALTDKEANHPNPEHLQEMQDLFAENGLIKLIEEKVGKPLPADTKEMIRLYYQGLSIKKIAEKVQTTFDKVRYRFRTIAEKADLGNFKEFIEQYKRDQNQGLDDKKKKS